MKIHQENKQKKTSKMEVLYKLLHKYLKGFFSPNCIAAIDLKYPKSDFLCDILDKITNKSKQIKILMKIY